MPGKQKKLMLLGGSKYLLPVIREAHALGIYVLTCDYLPDNIAHQYSDEYLNISILDREAVLAAAEEREIDGIMSFACDPGVTTAAYVAEKMGLPFPASWNSACILQDKGLFRAFLRDNGFTVPWAKRYTDASAALREAADYPWPMIIKPVDSAGSKGVSRVDNVAGLEAAISHALAFSHSSAFIVEQFICQKGYSSDTDCFVHDGELVFCSFDEQRFDSKAENPYTPAAYTWPSSMPNDIQAELRRELQRLMTLLKIRTGVFNVETRQGTDGKAYIMECSPRGGGNRLCEVLEMASGVKLIQNAVRAAVGMQIDEMSDPVYRGHWAEIILHGMQEGIFQELWISPELQPTVIQKDLWVAPGDRIERFSGANKAIGTLVMNFPNHDSMEKYMADESWYKVVIED